MIRWYLNYSETEIYINRHRHFKDDIQKKLQFLNKFLIVAKGCVAVLCKEKNYYQFLTYLS